MNRYRSQLIENDDNIQYIKEHFDQLQATDATSGLQAIRKKAFNSFNRLGHPL